MQCFFLSCSCFLQKWPLIGGLLIPMAVILVANVVIFILVMYRLSKTIPAKTTSEEKKTARQNALRRLRNAFSILILLGLTWAVGYFTIIKDVGLAVHVTFIILNSLQGFFIFVFYCLRQPRFRERWNNLRLRARLPARFRQMRGSDSSTTANTTSTMSLGPSFLESKDQMAQGNDYALTELGKSVNTFKTA